MRTIIGAFCVLAAAAPALAGLQSSAIGGRWQGQNYRMAAMTPGCDGGACTLTLDIVPCGEGWCGIEVAADQSCGATAMRIGAAKEETTGDYSFEGKLELAKGTEPYVIRAYLRPGAEGAPASLQLTGDTGGEFRIYRRSFPFHASLARLGEALCKEPAKPVS